MAAASRYSRSSAGTIGLRVTAIPAVRKGVKQCTVHPWTNHDMETSRVPNGCTAMSYRGDRRPRHTPRTVGLSAHFQP
jgi:hypothetical protein